MAKLYKQRQLPTKRIYLQFCSPCSMAEQMAEWKRTFCESSASTLKVMVWPC